jgi:hypothetical protein
MDVNRKKLHLRYSYIIYVRMQHTSIVLILLTAPKNNLFYLDTIFYLNAQKNIEEIFFFDLCWLSDAQDEKGSGEGVTTMVEKLAKRRGWTSSSCLLSINGI